jgi:hypothetical protein
LVSLGLVSLRSCARLAPGEFLGGAANKRFDRAHDGEMLRRFRVCPLHEPHSLLNIRVVGGLNSLSEKVG